MRKLTRSLKCVSGAVYLTACGATPTISQSKLSSIIDHNSMIAIDHNTPIPDARIKQRLRAIGKLSGGCTAFHLGQGIVATAGHCLPPPKSDTEQSCYALNISWGETLDEPSPGMSRCLEILDYRFDERADYAILRVDPAPEEQLTIEQANREETVHASAIVLGYPKDKTLSMSTGCEAEWTQEQSNQFFHHQCDTLPGNSGSPVFHVETASVIGIHNGDADLQQNYGTFLPAQHVLLQWQNQQREPAQYPQQLSFGPFPDQWHRALVHFTRSQAAYISLHLAIAVEDSYDKVVITDGKGRLREYSGQKELDLKRLPTPVTIAIKTDYSGTSESIKITELSYEAS